MQCGIFDVADLPIVLHETMSSLYVFMYTMMPLFLHVHLCTPSIPILPLQNLPQPGPTAVLPFEVGAAVPLARSFPLALSLEHLPSTPDLYLCVYVRRGKKAPGTAGPAKEESSGRHLCTVDTDILAHETHKALCTRNFVSNCFQGLGYITLELTIIVVSPYTVMVVPTFMAIVLPAFTVMVVPHHHSWPHTSACEA
jgi:hypothetical protein